MRILIITGLYPPNAPTATVRAPKFARYLLDRGHDVRVLAAQNLQFPAAVDPEIPVERITHISYVRRGRSAPMTEADQPKATGKRDSGSGGHDSATGLRALWWRLQYLPDPHVTWIAPAVEAGRRMAGSWRPDVMFSTGPPHSSHLVASRLSTHIGVPYVTELRDLWSDNLYGKQQGLGGRLIGAAERWLERRALGGATALIAVTKGASARLAKRFGKTVIDAANGFDPRDFEGLETPAPLDPEKLTIIHAGSTYGGRRSPEPLFAALAQMGADADGISVKFYGEDVGIALGMAERAGVAHLVEGHGNIPRSEVLRIERSADILLLLRFDTEGEKHVVAGKLYEYAGARRPILCHGQTQGEASDLIEANDLGLVSNDPDRIAGWLRERQAERQAGRLPDLPVGPARALTRDEQFAKVEKLLGEVITHLS
ncbi:MAG: glycosyltransferase [Pacificimonas sp.]